MVREGLASKVGDHTWTQSVQGAIATWSTKEVENRREFRMLITDQVAIAPCTDCIQERFWTLKAKPCAREFDDF